MTASFVSINEFATAYRFDGPEDGRVVVLSNSLMSNYDMWDWTVPALSDRYRVLRYDTRGHGRSGIQQMGAKFPDQVLSLGLCDTASEMPPRSMWAERIDIASTKGIPGLVDGTIQRWFTSEFIQRSPQDIEKVRKFILGTKPEGYIACASGIRDMAQTTMLLKIKSPTLVMTGRQDPACTFEQSTVLHRTIEGSEMVILENAAHLSNIEQPQAFNQALRKFIDQVDDHL